MSFFFSCRPCYNLVVKLYLKQFASLFVANSFRRLGVTDCSFFENCLYFLIRSLQLRRRKLYGVSMVSTLYAVKTRREMKMKENRKIRIVFVDDCVLAERENRSQIATINFTRLFQRLEHTTCVLLRTHT